MLVKTKVESSESLYLYAIFAILADVAVAYKEYSDHFGHNISFLNIVHSAVISSSPDASGVPSVCFIAQTSRYSGQNDQQKTGTDTAFNTEVNVVEESISC